MNLEMDDRKDVLRAMKDYGIDYQLSRKDFHELVMSNVWIPIDEMKVGHVYVCKARNFNLGVWSYDNRFRYLRHKFGEYFTDTEYHWDDGPPHGTCKPLLCIGV